MSAELDTLRESLATTRIRLGFSVGVTALAGIFLASGEPILALSGVIAAGQAAHDVLKSHNLGQEIAARQAISDTVRQTG